MEEVVVYDTKPAGFARSTIHREQSWPMYVPPAGLKILNYLLIPEKKLLVPWSYPQNFFGECWTLSHMSHQQVYFRYVIETSTKVCKLPSFLRRATGNLQMARVCNRWVQETQKEICAKETEAMKTGDRPKGLFKATKLVVTRFEGEIPFLTKNGVWA